MSESSGPQIEFGYNPPSGDRGKETIRPDEFLSDLEKALDVATKGFTSIWVNRIEFLEDGDFNLAKRTQIMKLRPT